MAYHELTHYGLTQQEFASKAGKHSSCFDAKPYLRALCGNGSYHAKCTKIEKRVDCPKCLKIIKS